MRRAITLIELLVAMAILVAVAAILLPVLARAKDRAIVATDISDMRQIGMAEEMYASDYDSRPDGLEPLIRGGYLKDERILKSERDDYKGGASRKASECVGAARMGRQLPADLPDVTFFSYKEAGILKWFYDAEIAPQPGAGWLVNPVRLNLDDRFGRCLEGTFQRLLWDGSVQTRHATSIEGTSATGYQYLTEPLFSLFADPDEEAKKRWYPQR